MRPRPEDEPLVQHPRLASVRQPTTGFTLVELLTVIAIIGILATIFLPGLSRAKFSAKGVVCKSNLRQLGLALQMYVSDNAVYPHTVDADSSTIWYTVTAQNYGSNGNAMTCPTFKGEWPIDKAIIWEFGNAFHRSPSSKGRVAGVSYGYNGFGVGSADSVSWTANLGLGVQVNPGQFAPAVKESEVVAPADMIAIADSMPQPGYPHIFAFLLSISSIPSPERHNGGANLSFADGHVITVKNKDFVSPEEFNRRRWNVDHSPHFEVKF